MREGLGFGVSGFRVEGSGFGSLEVVQGGFRGYVGGGGGLGDILGGYHNIM